MRLDLQIKGKHIMDPPQDAIYEMFENSFRELCTEEQLKAITEKILEKYPDLPHIIYIEDSPTSNNF